MMKLLAQLQPHLELGKLKLLEHGSVVNMTETLA